MSQIINNRKAFSLSEISKSIRKTISERYRTPFWVQAEMNKLNFYAQSGHCYPELVEKNDGVIIAEFRANLWKSDYEKINKQFLEILKEPLKDGIKILFRAYVNYHEKYGLSLRIVEIDPSFTLGDLEKENKIP